MGNGSGYAGEKCERCHSYEIVIQKIVRDSDMTKHMYMMQKCVDCGDERFEKDGSEIHPSEFFQSVYHLNN